MDFSQFVSQYLSPSPQIIKFNPVGISHYGNTPDYQGYYWYFETANYILDIHNLQIKTDFFQNIETQMHHYMDLIINCVVSGNGEWFNPHQTIKPFSLYVVNPQLPDNAYLLHKNSRYFTVGLKIKRNCLQKLLGTTPPASSHLALTKIFLDTKEQLIKPISTLAMDIVTCQLPPAEASPFFQAQAQQWLKLTLEAYQQLPYTQKLTPLDHQMLTAVANYINDHFTQDIPQAQLTKIACMSGTKLKNSFKEKYHLSITEFIQRKRINMAEELLLTTDWQIKYIATVVGYSSISRFSALYKRYKGIYPKELLRKN